MHRKLHPFATPSILDLAFNHLSYFDRFPRRAEAKGGPTAQDQLLSASFLRDIAAAEATKADKVLVGSVAVMPVSLLDPRKHGLPGRAASSLKPHYLNVTFQSVGRYFERVIAVVQETESLNLARELGLQRNGRRLEVSLSPPFNTSTGMVTKASATTLVALKRVLAEDAQATGAVLYTEADQVLHARQLPALLDRLHQGMLLSPHRLVGRSSLPVAPSTTHAGYSCSIATSKQGRCDHAFGRRGASAAWTPAPPMQEFSRGYPVVVRQCHHFELLGPEACAPCA